MCFILETVYIQLSKVFIIYSYQASWKGQQNTKKNIKRIYKYQNNIHKPFVFAFRYETSPRPGQAERTCSVLFSPFLKIIDRFSYGDKTVVSSQNLRVSQQDDDANTNGTVTHPVYKPLFLGIEGTAWRQSGNAKVGINKHYCKIF